MNLENRKLIFNLNLKSRPQKKSFNYIEKTKTILYIRLSKISFCLRYRLTTVVIVAVLIK